MAKAFVCGIITIDVFDGVYMERCFWCNLKNPLYVKYHDEEWGIARFDDEYLFEMLLLESFQAGLSWECVLNKRESFRKAFDNFDVDKISEYDEEKIDLLCEDKAIIRNRAKIKAAVNNARIFKTIVAENGSFLNYIKLFWDGKTVYDSISLTSDLSDSISADLKKRGMKFVGTTVIYSFLQSIGVINSHTEGCFLYEIKKES